MPISSRNRFAMITSVEIVPLLDKDFDRTDFYEETHPMARPEAEIAYYNPLK